MSEAEVLLWKGKYRRLLDEVIQLTHDVERGLPIDVAARLVRMLEARGVDSPTAALEEQ